MAKYTVTNISGVLRDVPSPVNQVLRPNKKVTIDVPVIEMSNPAFVEAVNAGHIEVVRGDPDPTPDNLEIATVSQLGASTGREDLENNTVVVDLATQALKRRQATGNVAVSVTNMAAGRSSVLVINNTTGGSITITVSGSVNPVGGSATSFSLPTLKRARLSFDCSGTTIQDVDYAAVI